MSEDSNRPRRARPALSNALVVSIVGVLIAAGLAIGARAVQQQNERRLLRQRVREVGVVAAAAVPSLQTPLTSAAVLAEATNADRSAMTSLLEPLVQGGRPFVSMAVWNVASPVPRRELVVGNAPKLADGSASDARTFIARTRGKGTLFVDNLLSSPDRRLGYALSAAVPRARYVVYAESSLPKNRQANIASNSAFSDLDYALFLGSEPDDSRLLASSTGAAPLHGRVGSLAVAFGDTKLLVEISPRGDLGGYVLANLWWMLALLTLGVTIAAAALVRRLTARRLEAELLASENGRLYAAQRSVALTLQHSLLSDDFPEVGNLQVGARYVAGVEDIDIGGDWYDVIGIDDDRAMIAVGDVSGRGLHAATTMASLRFAVRAYAAQGDAPGVILTKLSELLRIGRDGQFATVVCAVVDVRARRVTCASAGHPAPLLCGAGEPCFVPTAVGPPVGVRRGAIYDETDTALPERGTLLFYTDGLVERRGEVLDAGLARLAAAAATTDGSLEATLSGLLDKTIPEGSADDTALLGVRWTN